MGPIAVTVSLPICAAVPAAASNAMATVAMRKLRLIIMMTFPDGAFAPVVHLCGHLSAPDRLPKP